MSVSAIIVEGSQRARRLNANDSRPRSLDIVAGDERSVLEWILHALERIGVPEPVYVGGYHIEKIIERFPVLRVRYHAHGETEGGLRALLQCERPAGSLIIVTASTVLLPKACEMVSARMAARGVYGEGQAAGIYFLEAEHVPAAFELAASVAENDPAAGLEMLFERLPFAENVNLDGYASPITDQQAVVQTIFRGKGQTLDNLAPVIRGASHLPRERFKLSDWSSRSDDVLNRISRRFGDQTIIVRSSASGEDSLHSSAAGKYLSVMNVAPADRAAVIAAIESVAASYEVEGRALHPDDEILVQPQLRNISASGVLLTRDPQTGAPYFILCEDRNSGRSDLVTGGAAGILDQQFISWSSLDQANVDDQTRGLLDLGRELVQLSHLDALDIEYAIDSDGTRHLLQVRPLAAARKKPVVADEDMLDLVSGVQEYVKEKMQPIPGMVGSATVFGVMPDWNPAEMIGLSPRPLALSLYQHLIGDESWAEARYRMGYRDVRPERLIVALGGRPYVDVRASLNSFLPASLDEQTATRWVDACLDRLRAQPALHDKIEFDVALTCLSPDWRRFSGRLDEAGIDADKFVGNLRHLTNRIVSGAVEPIDRQLAMLDRLAERRRLDLAGSGTSSHLRARAVGRLLSNCRQFGVVPFSILARYAFISMNFLRDLLKIGAIDESDYQDFLRGIPTVAGEVAEDLARNLAVSELVERYGHLRPNSYEITSPNYARDPQQFLRGPQHNGAAPPSAFVPSTLQNRAGAIDKVLADLGLDIDAASLVPFMRRSIAGREQAKFEFTKNLDAALEGIAGLGKRLGLNRDEMSFLEIADILRLEANSLTSADIAQLHRRAAFNEKRWAATRALRLPDLIREADEVSAFRLEAWRANFITKKRVAAPAIWLDGAATSPEIRGAIVIARAADPGHDWIFAHGIAGLVTEYGGVASHMAIRAAEFGLPAAIGCGAVVMDTLRGAHMIELDCAAERVRRLS